MFWEMESLSSQQFIACIGVKQSLENNNGVCNTALKSNNSRSKSADTSKIDYTIWERNTRKFTQVDATKVSGKASSGGVSREDQGKLSREEQGKLSREDPGRGSRIIKSALASTNNDEFLGKCFPRMP